MSKILLTKKLDQELLDLLGAQARTVTVPDHQDDLFDRELADTQALLLSTAYQMTRERIMAAPHLKVISRTGVGVDNIDLKAAAERGVLVLNTPTANSETVAEHTAALILALVKQLAWYDRVIRQGDFAIRRRNLGHDLDGMTLGLLGCGRIGRLVADKMRLAFGLSVLAYDPYPADHPGITFVDSPDALCRQSDIVSLHMPLLPETRLIMNRERLALLRPGSYLVNTARGGLIDETALAEQLQDGRLAGAALDVFADEPLPSDHPLIMCQNTILTPHAAALTTECSARVARQAVEGIADYLAGRKPAHIVRL